MKQAEDLLPACFICWNDYLGRYVAREVLRGRLFKAEGNPPPFLGAISGSS